MLFRSGVGDGVRSLPDWVEGVGDCPELLGSLLWKRPDRSLGLEELEDMLDQYQREVSRNIQII